MTTIEVTPELSAAFAFIAAQFVGEAPTTEAAPKGTKRTAKKAAAKKTAKATEAPNAFVTWLGATAEQRKARQADNKVLATSLREAGLNPNGAVWKAAKAGEADLTVLRQIAADNDELPVKAAKKAVAKKASAKASTAKKGDRSAAAKKGAETRRVNALRKDERYAKLIAAEFSDAQAIAALSV